MVIDDAKSDGITQNRAIKGECDRQAASAKGPQRYFTKSAPPSSEQVGASPTPRILFSLVKPFCTELWEEYQLSNHFSSCFISYAHSDKAFAARLHSALEARGIQSWLDEKQILPGRDIYAEVEGAIRQVDKILLCCSEASLNSWWVDNEIGSALEKEQRLTKERGAKVMVIIPLNLDGYLFSDDWRSGWKPNFVVGLLPILLFGRSGIISSRESWRSFCWALKKINHPSLSHDLRLKLLKTSEPPWRGIGLNSILSNLSATRTKESVRWPN